MRSKDKQKEAAKKVIAAMTIGTDVNDLFPDMVNCIQTMDIELKKLVYLYLINYSKSNPDKAFMAVNTFIRDASNPNALIRALAIRTMGCIKVDKIAEYVCEPLRACLRDEDPYVRKTAALGVAKLNDINPDLVEEQGFIELLHELIGDSNPTVVANAVAALNEINEVGSSDVLQVRRSRARSLKIHQPPRCQTLCAPNPLRSALLNAQINLRACSSTRGF